MQDAVIIGGGPVGMGLAIDLGQRGHSVTVIEKHATPQQIPKGQNLTQRTMEHLAAWGCEDQVRALRPAPPGRGIGGLTSYGTLLSGWSYDWLQREKVRPYYFTDNERLPQYLTEAALRARAATLPGVTLAYGQTAQRVTDTGGSVTVTTDTGQTVTARFAIGCDGARSVTRQAAGITETRDDHDRLMVLLVFRSPALAHALKRFPDKSFYCVLHPKQHGYWLFFGRVDMDQTFFFHAPVPPGTTVENFDFTAFLQVAIGQTLPLTIDHTGFWDLRIAHADSYRAGRIFIAGDAAHSHPPYGGYGINTGFEDARNLGWKLSATLQGWAGPGLLDSYSTERHPVFASTAEDFITRFIREDNAFLQRYSPDRDKAEFENAWTTRNEAASEVTAFEPHYSGSPICPGSTGHPSAKGNHSFSARAGHHIAPASLSDGSSLQDRLGSEFTLLAIGADPKPFSAAAAKLAIPLTVITSDTTDDTMRYDASLILIRPDNYVAFAGPSTSDADRILRQAIGYPPRADG